MTEYMSFRGTLRGHNNWVTQIAVNPKYPNIILSSSRDKTLMVWRLKRNKFGFVLPLKYLSGHSDVVTDVVFSSDGNSALSCSLDKTLLLWDLETGKSSRRFQGHTKDVTSVTLSADNRQIVSGSRDKTIKLWNVLAECKHTILDEQNECVSCVRFIPNQPIPAVVSSGWDKAVKVWDISNCKLKVNHQGHSDYITTVTTACDGSLCASGGYDRKVMLWDLNTHKHLQTIDYNSVINALCFSPNRYWMCCAHGHCISIWDLESQILLDELKRHNSADPASRDPTSPICLSLAWSTDGQTLFAGYSDNVIRVWQLTSS